MAIETPKFEILQRDGKFEIREYQEYISASVEIEADFRRALVEGFRILADYIFGNNRAKTNIQMTVPVTEQTNQNKKAAATTQPKTSKGFVVVAKSLVIAVKTL